MPVRDKEIRKTEKVRIQLDLLRAQADMFDRLVAECGLETRKELFNTTMTLFNWAVKETKNGRKIASYNPSTDEVETIVMPALDFISSEPIGEVMQYARPRKRASDDPAGLSVVKRQEPAVS